MKTFKIIALGLLISLTTISCMKEEPELEACSCSTIIKDSNGIIVSVISSAEESPITGECKDLNFTIIDQNTGEVTSKVCGL